MGLDWIGWMDGIRVVVGIEHLTVLITKNLNIQMQMYILGAFSKKKFNRFRSAARPTLSSSAYMRSKTSSYDSYHNLIRSRKKSYMGSNISSYDSYAIIEEV